MRMGAIISAVAHAGVVAWVLMGAPKPFAAAPGDVVSVDIVTPDEIKPAEEKPEKTPPKPEEEKPPLIPPRLDKATQSQTNAVPSAPASAPSAQAAAPAPPVPQPKQQQQQQQQRSAAARPATPASPPPAPPPPAQPDPSIFAPASIPKLADIAPQPGPATVALGFDTAADSTAESGRQQAVSLLSHLKKCLRLPAGVDPARDLRVVMRVFLKSDGALASDPMLISGPAATEGPALVQAATRALKQCQPYALPPEKYQDWKMMDLTLRPRDMTGG